MREFLDTVTKTDQCAQYVDDIGIAGYEKSQVRPKMLSSTEFTVGPDDCLDEVILPNLPPSIGYEHIMRMMDVFSRYLFTYPTQDMTARTSGKTIIDGMARHCYLSTVILTDKGTQFRSEVVSDIAQTLDIRINQATTSHAQTIGILERPHAPLKTTQRYQRVEDEYNGINTSK